MPTLLESTLAGKGGSLSSPPPPQPQGGTLLNSALKNGNSNIGAIQGTEKLGTALISGIGGEVSKLFQDVYKTSQMPVRNLGDFWNLITQTGEEVTRPVRALATAIPQAALGAVSMPIQSAIQAATGNSTSYSVPLLGKFQSYQDMKKELAPQFGESVSSVFPVVQEALNALSIAPTDAAGSLLRSVLPDATAAPASVQFFGDAAKLVSKEDLGTFENMTKMQAAIDKLAFENNDSVNIQKMMKDGMSAQDAQKSALNAIKERMKTITPKEHLDMIYSIARNIAQTPEDIARSLPNYLAKAKQFASIAPDIASKVFNPQTGDLGIDPAKLVLLRNDTLTDTDVQKMIDEVRTKPFTGNMNTDAAHYKNIVDELYKKYPGLQFYNNRLEPVMGAGPGEFPAGSEVGQSIADAPVEGFRGKYDLIKRLSQIKGMVNKEVLSNDPAVQEQLDAIRSAPDGMMGYKIGFSPLEYTPMVPIDYQPLPVQNYMGKFVDKLGLREIDKRAINEAWHAKFSQEFQKAFPGGLDDGKGNIWQLDAPGPSYAKSGAIKAYPQDSVLERLYAIAKANNSISVTEISPKDLRALFGAENGDKLASVLAASRVLPKGLEGAGVDLLNRMRQNKIFDQFYRSTLVGRFNWSPGYAVRHYFKNQILGAFEGKPINIMGLADTEFGSKLISRFPSIFGGATLGVKDWTALKNAIGNVGVSVDPSSQVWVFSHMGEDLQNLAVKNTLQSPNFFEKMFGYTVDNDIADLARSFAAKHGITIQDLETRPDLASQLRDVVRNTYNYGEGFISSPAIKTLNTIFYPVRFETKVLMNTAKWWANSPVLTRSLVVKMFNEGITNSQSKEAQDFLKKNALLVRAISYLVPYPIMMNVFQDAMNTMGNLNHPSKALGSAWSAITDNYQLGGLMFGMLIYQAQNQGILPQDQYIDPAGKKYPIYVPKGTIGRLKTFISNWLSFVWPSGLKTIEMVPGGIGSAVSKAVPSEASYLPADQHKKISPMTVNTHW
ncbi:MAG: hypothetical protein KGJ90_04880 [Patescibacteria group bacterium]|nr:hypothetical protein [Patescibacteria group bacterium]